MPITGNPTRQQTQTVYGTASLSLTTSNTGYTQIPGLTQTARYRLTASCPSAAKRRWGYWALPILYSDRLVGKLDTAIDRTHGVLRVNAIHQDMPFSKAPPPRR